MIAAVAVQQRQHGNQTDGLLFNFLTRYDKSQAFSFDYIQLDDWRIRRQCPGVSSSTCEAVLAPSGLGLALVSQYILIPLIISPLINLVSIDTKLCCLSKYWSEFKTDPKSDL